MDLLTFILYIISAVAWPIAAVVLVAILKDEIKKIAPFLKRFKAGPLEAEFEREVKELKETTPTSNTNGTHAPASKAFLFQLAELHPRSAIIESWVRVEAAARATLASISDSTTKSSYVPVARLAEPLVITGALNQSQVTLFHELRRLRNDVAHENGIEPTQESAQSYIDLASSLQGELEKQVKKKGKKKGKKKVK